MGLNFFFYQPLSCKISGCIWVYVYVCSVHVLACDCLCVPTEMRSLFTLSPWGARPFDCEQKLKSLLSKGPLAV